MIATARNTAAPTAGITRGRLPRWRLPQFGPAPGLETLANATATRVALPGSDFPGARLEVLVEEGDDVSPGAVVMRDRRHPDIAITTPLGGVVSRIRRGPRRALLSLEIRVAGAQDVEPPSPNPAPAAAEIGALMLANGLWPALRSRPFGYLPLPDDRPAALFVTAMDTRPLAPDPAALIGLHPDWFESGLSALARFVDAPVYLCNAPGTSLPMPGSGDIRPITFAGPHPAGLAGVHIQACCPVGGGGRAVWQIQPADVMSLGRLLLEGVPWHERIVSVAGPGISSPRLVSATRGTALSDVLAICDADGNAELLAGSPIDGAPVSRHHGFLGLRQTQITAMPPGSMATTRPTGAAWPLIPTTDLDRHTPPGILATPLLRALLVGDHDRARQLGALELLEEDLAGINAVCSSSVDFGSLLRQSLDRIARDES